MADIRLAKPAAGTTQTVPSAPDGRFIFDFPADAATLTRNGDDLVLTFEDGAAIQLQGFYTTYSKEEMPSFQVDGVEISGQDFFAALDEDLMPAAGPASGSSAARGGRYNEYGGSDLLDGLDHLGRLDIGFDGGTQLATDTVEPSPYSEVDHGVTVTPSGVGAATEVVTVYEAGLAGGSQAGEKDAPTMAGGSLSINAPDGVASIVIGGVVVFENGALTGKVVSTDEGTLSVTGYDPATGKLDFSYRLDRNTTEHVKSDPDTDTQISHTLVVTVTDTDGDSGSTTITVNVVDDAPTAVDDTVIGEEAQAQQGVVGDVLENDKTGADDLPNAVTSVKHDGVEGKVGSALKGAYGELTLHADGTYTYKLDKNVDVEKDTSVTETFTYTIMDADGDTSEATLTITIRGDEKEPVAPGEDKAEIVVDEGALSDGSGQHVVHGISGKDSFTVNLNGEDGSIMLTGDDGKSVTLQIDGGEYVHTGDSTITVNGVQVTVTSAEPNGDGWTVKYNYELTGDQDHNKPGATGADDTLKGMIGITVTDESGDTATDSIMVNVQDDGPVFSEESLTVDVANESEKYWSYGEKIEFTGTEASTLFEGKHIVKMQCEENTLSLYVGKIQFDANGNIDTSNNWNEFIDNQATFHINGEYKEHGIGVHSNYTGGIDFSNSYMWDNRKNEIGYDPISRQSEAVIIELDKPAVNMNIDLSLFFSAAGSDTNPEKAIFLFYKDGEYVGKSHLSSDEASGDVQQNGFSALPPGGFDTVVIAASDNGVDPNRSYDNSEFNISAITFNKFGGVDRTLTGQLDATSADGIKGYSVDTDKLATLELKSGGKPISYGWNEDTGRLLAKAGDATVFELVLNTETGAWTMVQYKEYEGELELPFTATDGDDDSTSISVEIPPTDAKSGTYKVTDSDAEKAVLAAAEQEMKSAVRSGEALATAAVLAGMATVLPDEVPAAEGDRPDTPDETLVAAPAEAADAPAALSFVEEGAALPDSPVEGMDDTPLLFANLALAGQEELMVSAVQTDAADGPLWADASGTDDTSGTVVGETATAGPGAAHPGTAAPEAVLHGTDADDILLGGDGDELIFGGSGDDFIDGGEGRDTIYAGDGNDIIVYDQQDYLVSGGSGIDFMVSDDSTLSLTKLLQGTGDGNGPIVDSIEVLITGKDALSLTSLEQMAKDYGISINGSSLELDSTLWAKADNGYRFTGDLDNDRTPDDLFLQVNSQTDAQVSVELVPSDDIAEAVQRAEIEHSNG